MREKIANTAELQTELLGLLAYAQSFRPSRQVLARELEDLSSRVAAEGGKRKYNVRFVHKISPKDTDTKVVELNDNAFSNKNTLAKALRAEGVLSSGDRIREMRVEGEKTVVFPSSPGMTTGWHSIIITPA